MSKYDDDYEEDDYLVDGENPFIDDDDDDDLYEDDSGRKKPSKKKPKGRAPDKAQTDRKRAAEDDDGESEDDDYYEDDGYYDPPPKDNGSFSSWLIAIILTFIPIAGFIYLLVKGVIKKDTSARSTWARAALTVQLVICCVLTVLVYAGKIPIKGIKLPISTSASADADRDDISGTEDGSGEASSDITVKFTSGAAIEMVTGGTKYKELSSDSDDYSEVKSYSSDDGKTLTVVRMDGGDTMQSMLTEEGIKSISPDSKINDYDFRKNDEFSMASFTEETDYGTSYEYRFCGTKGDYISITAEEPIQIAASYVD